VIIDATLVRAVLVPACQRLLGRAAWYAPAPLRRLQTRVGLTEAGLGADPDGLGVAELADAVDGELAAVARGLDAAERQLRI